MKAISLHQPFASAIAEGAKMVETRSWQTKHRGMLAIHAAAKISTELDSYGSCWNWCGALNRLMGTGLLSKQLPFGGIIAVVTVIGVRRTDDFRLGEVDSLRWRNDLGSLYTWTERQMGDFSLGRYGWILADLVKLREPLPFKGRQGVFEVPDELILPLIEGGLNP